jgi:hypothetical protein
MSSDIKLISVDDFTVLQRLVNFQFVSITQMPSPALIVPQVVAGEPALIVPQVVVVLGDVQYG